MSNTEPVLRLNLEAKSAAKGMGEDQALGEWTRFGPFPVTVGRLAETQIWVRADDAAQAALVLKEIGIDCDPGT